MQGPGTFRKMKGLPGACGDLESSEETPQASAMIFGVESRALGSLGVVWRIR